MIGRLLNEIRTLLHFLPKITLFYLIFSWATGLELNIIALVIAIAFDIIDYLPMGP